MHPDFQPSSIPESPPPAFAGIPVTVVIPAYRCAATLPPVLDALFAQSMPPARIIVVDDASPDELEKRLASYAGRIEVIRHPANCGLARSYNDGLRQVSTPFAMTLHSDCILEPRYLELLWKALGGHPGWAVATGQYLFPDIGRMSSTDRLYLALNLIPLTPVYADGEEDSISFVEGKADLFRTDCLRQVGFFDESFVLTSEDQDISAKFRANGWNLGVVGAAHFRSAFGGTQDSVCKVLRKQRTYARGQALLSLRHGRRMLAASNANRNARALHRLVQLAMAFSVFLLLASVLSAVACRAFSLASLLAVVAVGLLLLRWTAYLWICRWLPLRERPVAAALGCVADFCYAVGAIEGLAKGAFRGKA
ncbi:MAG: glycosyltransferase [Kiritimatiellae bacterium]|nr:glycosyltransferase [Kiritimatiellia bacterium]